jgi:hypothetical protein
VRKRNPNAAIDEFQTEIDASLTDWRDTRRLVGEAGRLAQRASMDALMRLAVAYERFRSDWHVAAITRDASNFNRSQQNRAEEALKGDSRRQLVAYLALGLPIHPTLADVGAILDPNGGNVPIPGINAWKKLADRHLCDPWSARVNALTASDGKVTEAVIAMRNAAAHRSPQAHAAMTAALDGLGLPALRDLRRRPEHCVSLTGIPTYLNGDTSDGTRRVERFHELLRDLAERLRVA